MSEPHRRQSPNVLRLGDRVWVRADGARSVGMMGVIRRFDGPKVFIQLDGLISPLAFRFDQVS